MRHSFIAAVILGILRVVTVRHPSCGISEVEQIEGYISWLLSHCNLLIKLIQSSNQGVIATQHYRLLVDQTFVGIKLVFRLMYDLLFRYHKFSDKEQ